jgi:hypothetical protein
VTENRSGRVVVTGANRGIGLELPDGGPTGGFYRDGRPVPW